MHIKFELKTEQNTHSFGEYLAHFIKPPLVLGFKGEIGMGKTSMIRAMLRAMGIQTAIKSPTFNLVETYSTKIGPIHHFDLYRLTDVYDLEDLGFRDYLDQKSITCIEWPENAPLVVPFIDIMIEFSYRNGEGRQIQVSELSRRAQYLFKQMEEHPWLER